ncbi:MAG: DUF1926 domain-containing protein, partial [Deferribacterales bacterium]
MKLPFLFGIHCHQPVDNFGHIVDDVIEKSYLPFLRYAERFENFKFAVHYSGWLLEYIKKNSDELFKLFKELSDKGQIEFFSGGFYEPVLSSIPKRDRIGQITKLNNYIYHNFGQKPKGLWLTERVWDSSIIPDLVECGIEYLVVDDYHFISLGFSKGALYGYYLTEQDGYCIKVFPIDQKLRYIVPFRETDVIEGYLLECKGNGAKGAILFDDGEKFGLWPKTYEWVYENGWLDRFFDKFIGHPEIYFKHYYEFANEEKPLGLAYLSMTSYMEMGQWSLFSDKGVAIERLLDYIKNSELKNYSEEFIKGSHWKNFFIKYPESNHLHKRVLDISKRLEGRELEDVKDMLYRAECNDVFWHGIFGGVYLPNLRDNAFRYIINAEKRLDEIDKKLEGGYFTDLLYDGYGVFVLKDNMLSTIFTLKHGGQLKSLDIRSRGINLINTLSRRKESYHYKLLDNNEEEKNNSDHSISTIHEMGVKLTDDLKNEISFDWYDRNCFVDHFVDFYEPLNFKKSEYRELGDFVNQPFEYRFEKGEIVLTRNGFINNSGCYNTSIEKRFRLQDGILFFDYNISSDYPDELYYILEMNLHFYDYGGVIVNGFRLNDTNRLKSDLL